MKNYGRFFNERNEKHKLTAVILLTAGIITFVAVLHTVRVIIRESGGALERDAQEAGVRVEVADRALERISKKENCFAAMVYKKAEGRFDFILCLECPDRGKI